MIFYFTGAGVPLFSDVERVFQGSAKANTLFFVCPTASANAVSVCFGLPDASATQEYAMTLLTESGISHCVDDDGNAYNVWRLAVPAAITQKFGTVRVQFFVRDGDGATLASATNSFTVEQGVVPSTPDYVEGIGDVADKISEINAKLDNVYTKTQADALYSEKIAKTDIAAATGNSSSKVMSQAAVTSAINARVKANPALTGSEADLSALEVGGTKYKVPQGGTGTEVEANPTLSGSEADLTAIKVGGTKYKVPQGGTGTEVEANPALTGSEADLTAIKVGGTKYKVPQGGTGTEVEANPTLSGSEANLTAIKVGGTKYKVPQGSTETEVEANPSASATKTLSKIKVDGVVYSVPQSGSSSSNGIETVKVNGEALTVSSKAVNIPVVSDTKAGVISSEMKNIAFTVFVDDALQG